ncbi:MAG: OmpA family protein [Cytophagaceae bacterium]|jgi:hypothetical protein|nr:OmpA family protein [Cytophagaceae bacterium]
MKYLLLVFFPFTLFAQSITKENLGPNVNTKYNDLAPVLSLDGNFLYFIIEGHPKNTKFYNSDSQDIWYSEKDSSGKWSVAKHLTKPFNQRLYNSIESVSIDGSILYIRGAYEKGTFIGPGFSYMYKTPTGWSEPVKMNIIDLDKLNAGTVDALHVCPDGKTILLAFTTKKDSRINDLYVSYKIGPNTWSKPKYLSDINTKKYVESTPFMAADNKTLYFSSDRPNGVGSRDVYMTRRLDNSWNKWSKPVNLGDSINTPDWDAYFITDASGVYGYIVSSENSFGESDIYKIKLPSSIRPEPVEMVTGFLKDSNGTFVKTSLKIQEGFSPTTVQEGICHPTSGKFTFFLTYGHTYTLQIKNKHQFIEPFVINLADSLPYTDNLKDSVLLVKNIWANESYELLHPKLNKTKFIWEAYLNKLLDNEYSTFEIHTNGSPEWQYYVERMQHVIPNVKVNVITDFSITDDRLNVIIIQ